MKMKKPLHIPSELIICCVIAMCVYAVYSRVGGYDFITLDDNQYVFENTHVKNGLSIGSIHWAFTNTETSIWIPVTWLSYMADYELWGLNPGGFHRTNALFHIVNALLIFLLFRMMTGTLWPCVVIAGLFAVHPLQVESVAWVTERKDVLSVFFMFTALIAYVHYTRLKTLYRYCMVVILFTLGLLSKPMIVTFPFVLILLDYWPLHRLFRVKPSTTGDSGKKKRNHPHVGNIDLHILAEKVPFLALSVAVSVITLTAFTASEPVLRLDSLTPGHRFSNSLVSYATYLKNIVWPVNLPIFYPNDRGVLPPWGALLLVILITIMAIRLRKRYPFIFFGWLWFLGTLIPVIGIFPTGIQVMADRFTYMPIMGIFTMITWYGASIMKGKKHERLMKILAAGTVLALLSAASWVRLGYWRDNTTLFAQAVRVTNDHWLAYNSLGTGFEFEGDLVKAAEYYREAVRINPYYCYARYNLGRVYALTGDYDQAGEQFATVLSFMPDFADAHYNLALVLHHQGKLDMAAEHYEQSLRIKKDNYYARWNLGRIYEDRGDISEAMDQYTRALRLNPDFAEAHYNLGNVLAEEGRLAESIRHYSDALRIRPDYTEALNNLGNVLEHLGRYNEAVDNYAKALVIKPDNPVLHSNMGAVLQKLGKTGEAAAHFHEAERLKEKSIGSGGEVPQPAD